MPRLPWPTGCTRTLGFSNVWASSPRRSGWTGPEPIVTSDGGTHRPPPLFTPVGAVLTAILAVGGFAAFLVAQSSGRFSIGDANAPLDSLILLILAFV